MRFPILLGLVCTSAALASNWPQFRGPAGDGHAATNKIPVQWSAQENVKWATEIHGRGWSSPVIWGKQIWLTTATPDAKELFAVCVDADTGKITRDLKLFTVERPQFIHQANSPASPTPVLEAGRVYVTFGSPGTACLDTTSGKVIWERRDLECNHYRGAGSSPIIYRDLLIMNFDGSDAQFLIALDKRTGKTVWRKDRSIDFKDLGADGKPKAEGDDELRVAAIEIHDQQIAINNRRRTRAPVVVALQIAPFPNHFPARRVQAGRARRAEGHIHASGLEHGRG